MVANIFGKRFLGRREPAWHGLGEVFTDPLTATEAVKKAGADYRVEKHPLQVQIGSTFVPYQDEHGNKEKVALVRLPTEDDNVHRIFGIVSPRYHVMQNVDLAEKLDHLSKRWPVETIGVLGYGETIFITLDAGETKIGGDEIKKFFLITDTKKGGESLKIAFTPVRVVCGNTLTYGLSSALSSISLRHYATLGDELDFQMNLVELMQEEEAKALAAFEMLSKKKVIDVQVEQILTAVYPVPEKPRRAKVLEAVGDVKDLGKRATKSLLDRYFKDKEGYEKHVTVVEGYRESTKRLYKENYPNTAWGVFNAVVEVEDYRKGGNAAESALFGARAIRKSRAFEAAVNV